MVVAALLLQGEKAQSQISNLVYEKAVPFHTQQDRRHETTTNRKSVKNWYIDYIGKYTNNFIIIPLNNTNYLEVL